jgi:hypothetical protein
MHRANYYLAKTYALRWITLRLRVKFVLDFFPRWIYFLSSSGVKATGEKGKGSLKTESGFLDEKAARSNEERARWKPAASDHGHPRVGEKNAVGNPG